MFSNVKLNILLASIATKESMKPKQCI